MTGHFKKFCQPTLKVDGGVGTVTPTLKVDGSVPNTVTPSPKTRILSLDENIKIE